MPKELLGDIAGTAIVSVAPAADILSQEVDQRKVIPLFFDEQLGLSRSRPVGLVPVASLSTKPRSARLARPPIVEPVVLRLFVGETDDRFLDRLKRDLLLCMGHRSVLQPMDAHDFVAARVYDLDRDTAVLTGWEWHRFSPGELLESIRIDDASKCLGEFRPS